MNKMILNIQLFGGSCSIGTITETTTGADTNQSIFSIPATLSRSGSTHNNDNAYMTMQWKYASASSWTTISKQTFGLPTSKTSVTKTWSLTLTHADNGTLENVQFRVQWYITDSTKGTTGATTFEPTTIPRASQPTLNYSSREFGQSVVITTNRYSSSFTHTLNYTFNGTSGTIATNVGASYTWSIPNSMMNSITTATQGQCIINCKTYNGTTLVGSTYVSLILVVPTSVVPTISNVTQQEVGDVPSSWNTLVQNKSKLEFTITATGAYGSTISSYTTTGDGYTYTTNPATTNYIRSSGSMVFNFKVVDSRGRIATASLTRVPQPYSNPTISTAQVQRCDENGNIDNNGEYMYISYGASISSCNGYNTPSAVYKVGYRVHNTGSYQYVPLTTNANSYSASGMLFSDGIKAASSSGTKVQFSTNNTYDIQFYVKDYFMEYTNVQSLDAGFDLMNFNPSGKAMAIGKVSEAGANEAKLEVAVPTTMNDLLTMNTPTNSYSGAVIYAGTNHNEASISYMNNTNTKGYVLGYGTGGNDGMGIWSHETGQNVFKVNKSGDGAFANSVKTSNYYLGNDNLTSILGNLVGHYSYQADMNNALSPGIYSYYQETLNKPSNNISGFATYGMYFVVKTDTWLYQIAFANWGTPRIATRVSVDNGSTWTSWDNMGDTGWTPLATTSDFESYSWAQLQYRNLNGVVSIVGVLKVLNTTAWNTLVATLPVGSRPPVEYNVVCRTSKWEVIKAYVNNSGEIHTLDMINGTYLNPGDSLELAITYIAGN